MKVAASEHINEHPNSQRAVGANQVWLGTFDSSPPSDHRGSVKLIGLGGGIGSGKSTVSLRLAERGAVIVDADVVAREVVAAGTPGLAAIVTRFGPEMLDDDGNLRRAALAAVVFNDTEALKDLNAITHPAIGLEMMRRVTEHLQSDRVVVWDAALLVTAERKGMVGRMVVDIDPETAVDRLQAFRNFSESDARARIANQMTRAERLAQADLVIDNSGTPEDLDVEVDRAWAWISTRPNTSDL